MLFVINHDDDDDDDGGNDDDNDYNHHNHNDVTKHRFFSYSGQLYARRLLVAVETMCVLLFELECLPTLSQQLQRGLCLLANINQFCNKKQSVYHQEILYCYLFLHIVQQVLWYKNAVLYYFCVRN